MKSCPNITRKLESKMTLLRPAKKQIKLSTAKSARGIIKNAAPSKLNLPFSYLSSFSLSTALLVILNFPLCIPIRFMMTSKHPNRLPETDLIDHILCSFQNVVNVAPVERTSYKCPQREDTYTVANTANHGLETWTKNKK